MAKKAKAVQPADKEPEAKTLGIRYVSAESKERFMRMQKELQQAPNVLFDTMMNAVEGKEIVTEQLMEANSKVNDLTTQLNLYESKLTHLSNQLETAASSQANKDLEIQALTTQLTQAQNNNITLDASKNEFIGFLTKENFEIARVCRPFLKKDELISGDPQAYPNELMNIAVDYFLNHQYYKLLKNR